MGPSSEFLLTKTPASSSLRDMKFNPVKILRTVQDVVRIALAALRIAKASKDNDRK